MDHAPQSMIQNMIEPVTSGDLPLRTSQTGKFPVDKNFQRLRIIRVSKLIVFLYHFTAYYKVHVENGKPIDVQIMHVV